jgi:NAD(P)-dependent dehydrogenase (short-subunit alcohol dehydrogenase family)
VTAAPLAGRHAVVTGASRGIGAAIARELARRGATLTLLGRDEVALADVRQGIEASGAVASAIVCDVTDHQQVRRAFAGARETSAPFILVNNAGQAHGGYFVDTPPEVWERIFDVNVGGAVACIREVLPGMVAAGAGRIVNIASVAGLKAFRKTAAYTASKHAVVGLTRALALEVGRKGVTVNAVCPGYTATAMAELAERNIMRTTGVTAEEARRLVLRDNPRGRLIEPDEVARVVGWLCTPAAQAINGQAIPVAGGEL